MTYRAANQIFDFDEFKKDVLEYKERFNLTLQNITDATELERSTINSFFYNKTSDSGLLVVATLAQYCDLSLDKYIVENPSCEKCSTIVNRRLVKAWHPVGRPCDKMNDFHSPLVNDPTERMR